MFSFISNIFKAITGGGEPDGATRAAPGARPTGLRVTIIDVGKGDCILVQTPAMAILIDTGYKDTADQVLETLGDQGVERLDAMIITHYDRDHVEGMREIGRGMGVGAIYLPGYEGNDKNYRTCMKAVRALGVKTSRVIEPLTLDLGLGDARLTVLPSGVQYEPGTRFVEGNDNDMSLVAKLTYGDDSYLFAGDLKEAGIASYLAHDHGHFGVLKVPHHGRYCAGSQAFLDAVRPQVAVITDSDEDEAQNKVLKLLKSVGARTLRTSVHGTVVVESDGHGAYTVSDSDSD